MTLKDWLENRWVEVHKSSASEVENQLRMIERDIRNAKISEVDSEWRLNMAFNAQRLCADLALRVSGYRVKVSAGAHEKTIDSLRYTLQEHSETVALIRSFLNKRGMATYDGSGIVTDTEAAEAIELAESLSAKIRKWLETNHPDLYHS